ncbi:hypothetical protein [Streptomyces coelicoflavus]|uniref:hypothetical protein n=1 Tax=Streptomyces coelicoflavus TaxID=285562 RepID=UPI002E2698A6
MIVAGWASGSVLAGTIVVLAATALRIRSPLNDGPNREMDDRVARARDAWHEALLERGILPFLREALGEPGTAALHRAGPAAPSSSRMPHLGYSRPGFTSPDGGPNAGPRPSFSRPDYTSPDLGEPEHQPE